MEGGPSTGLPGVSSLPPSGGDEEHPLLDFGDASEGPFFPSLKAASVQSAVPFGPRAGRPLRRLKDPDLARAFAAAGWSSQSVSPGLLLKSNGFSLHAATRVKAGDRDAREKLCRYVNRPALCLKRLEVHSDGQISWSLRKPWRDGTKAFVMTPYEFLARLAAIVPHPREHQLTYQGVLAPASPLRDEVVPRSVKGRERSAGDKVGTKSSQCRAKRSSGQNYIPWAELLQRVFGEDVLRCPHCRGRRHMISAITDPEAVRRVLESVREGLERNRPPPPETQIPMPARQGRLGLET